MDSVMESNLFPSRITWESWKNGRKIIHRDSKGRFLKDNFSMPLNWIPFGHKVKKETRDKISKKLIGVPLTEIRKKHVSIATKRANWKWAKGCKHGIVPISSCRECMRERLKEWRHKVGINKGYYKND